MSATLVILLCLVGTAPADCSAANAVSVIRMHTAWGGACMTEAAQVLARMDLRGVYPKVACLPRGGLRRVRGVT